MDRLYIERKGGFAGFGGPGAKIKSTGELNLSTLPQDQQHAIEKLFKETKPPETPSGPASAATSVPADVPVYHITRQTPSGPKTIQVPENLAPDVVRNSVKDRLE